MERKKIWFNVTRIENGWLVKYPLFALSGTMELGRKEAYFETLGEMKDFMSLHTRKNGLDAASYGDMIAYKEMDVGEGGIEPPEKT